MGECIGRHGRDEVKGRAQGSAMYCGRKRAKYVRCGLRAEAMNTQQSDGVRESQGSWGLLLFRMFGNCLVADKVAGCAAGDSN